MNSRFATYSVAVLLSTALVLPADLHARDRSNQGLSIGGANGISVGIGRSANGPGLGVSASVGGSNGVNANADVSSTSSSGLGASVGASVGGPSGVNAGTGARVGGSRGVSAGVGASIGGARGVNAGVGASVGGNRGVSAGVSASVGGSRGINASVGAGIGGGGADVDLGVGIGGSGGNPTPTVPGVDTGVTDGGGSVPGRPVRETAALQQFGAMSRSEQQQMLRKCRSVSSAGYEAALVNLCKLLQMASR